MLNRCFLISLVLLAYPFILFSQSYYFKHYQVENGLSNNAVMCSVQDKLGYMWFGTRDGLNRFDGYTFKVYRFRGSNFVHALHIDPSGSLLAGTEKDIYRYDAKSDSFVLLVSSNNFAIDEIVSDRSGNIWFNAGNILSRYSESTRQLKIYEPG